MKKTRFGSGLAMFVVVAGLAAASNPQVDAIHAQIKTLQAERTDAVKKIHAWYTQFIKRDRFTNDVLAAERKTLHAEEQLMLSMNTDPQARAAIKAHYESLSGLLRVGQGLDKTEIARLENLRKAHETHVKNAYTARIEFLQGQAKAAAQTKPKK